MLRHHLTLNGFQIARKRTKNATKTHYTLKDVAALRADCLAADKKFPRHRDGKRKRAALKANISRRVSYVLMAKLCGYHDIVQTYCELREQIDGLKDCRNLPMAEDRAHLQRVQTSLAFEAPYAVAVERFGLEEFRLPPLRVREALFRADPKPANQWSAPVIREMLKVQPAVRVFPAPAQSVSERQRAAAYKAWETRRARALVAA